MVLMIRPTWRASRHIQGTIYINDRPVDTCTSGHDTNTVHCFLEGLRNQCVVKCEKSPFQFSELQHSCVKKRWHIDKTVLIKVKSS